MSVKKTTIMHLTEKDLKHLSNELDPVAAKWMPLGVALGMKSGKLNEIEQNFPKDQQRCLLNMLTRLIRRKRIEWKDITNALKSESVDEGVLAASLEEKHCSSSTRKHSIEQEDKSEYGEGVDGGSAPSSSKKGKFDQETPRVYQMQHTPKHGKALIINNIKFDDRPDRHGSNKDKESLKATLEKLGYDVQVKENLTQAGMMLEVTAHAQSVSSCDSYICCILSHGKEGEISGSDNKYIKIRDLAKELTKISTLRGKPKIFFIQACQGKEKPEALPDDLEHEEEEQEEDGEGLTLPRDSDFFYGYASTPETASLRNPDKGTWYIQELCQILSKHHDKEELVTMVTRVHHEVATKGDYQYVKYRQQPQLVSTLRGPVYFK